MKTTDLLETDIGQSNSPEHIKIASNSMSGLYMQVFPEGHPFAKLRSGGHVSIIQKTDKSQRIHIDVGAIDDVIAALQQAKAKIKSK